MKKTIVLLISFIFLLGSCTVKNEIQKPEKLIEKEVMENILYDLALLQALKGYNPQELKKNSINPKSYIYQKYKIDSMQFIENNKYYSSKIEEYKLMYEHIISRIEKEKKIVDAQTTKDFNKKQKQVTDSLKKGTRKHIELKGVPFD
ncbi:DUF4296 domain-containing protein [Flavobacterium terrae]|uniref:DUF4296 domain-containing protein n=1 Tax=Flavobacterium terrae TaxID=415425 RepID=A0A1M6BAP6_9FLAO|nr:DUF4296 domain-containing protein [Flavobacterium terrae]SHI45782.1 protein of unknown function [Flavobacterium terrae]